MPVSITSSFLVGLYATTVTIEIDSSNSLPGITVTGHASKTVEEAKDRVRRAIINSGMKFPPKRITINLSPASLSKHGCSMDLAMALGVLLNSGQLPADCLADVAVVGELGLDGSIKPIKGVIGHILAAKQAMCASIIIPSGNRSEAKAIRGISIIPATNIRELNNHLLLEKPIPALKHDRLKWAAANQFSIDVISGQDSAKKAAIIAAAGNHNLLLAGPPGTGKSTLARALPSLLPPMTHQEMTEVIHIQSSYSQANKSFKNITIPFRAPHHSSSHTSLVGGGKELRIGEVTMAHNGVLFLDELPEFSRQALESLRQPIEEGSITISRINYTVELPAKCLFVGALNPCPCGYYGSSDVRCRCSMQQIIRYQSRLSGPLLDRFDIFCWVENIDHEQLFTLQPKTDIQHLLDSIANARQVQIKRQGIPNASIKLHELLKISPIETNAKRILSSATNRSQRSVRSFVHALRVSRTIADLLGARAITAHHVKEALQYTAAPNWSA